MNFSIHANEKYLNDFLGVALDHATHAMYTEQWRKLLPYGKKYSVPQIYEAAQQIYANSPELLKWARFTIIGG